MQRSNQIQRPESPPVRVAAYCRISTSHEEQQTSLKTQIEAFSHTIRMHAGWELVELYADEGVTGTSAARRPQFMRMIADCEAGRIDCVITKSISRFARNTLECLTFLRRLQNLGVQVVFEEDHIDTATAFSEMMLTVLAAFAQEESRSISENLKWGIRKRYQEGRDRWSPLFGYRRDEAGRYQIVEEQAQVVREVFSLYEAGLSMGRVAQRMMDLGHRTPLGKINWTGKHVASMLCNERYAGDILLQKLYTQDHLSHKTRKNDGAVPSYYLRDHHTPIVARGTFECVNRIRALRGGPGRPDQYPFGTMLHCPLCAGILVRHKLLAQQTGSAFFCEGAAASCGGFVLRAGYVEQALLEAYDTLDVNRILARGEATQALLEMKAIHPRISAVEYCWLNALVSSMRIEENLMVHIIWRCGLVSRVPISLRCAQDEPRYMAEMQQNALLNRKKKGEKSERIILIEKEGAR